MHGELTYPIVLLVSTFEDLAGQSENDGRAHSSEPSKYE